MKLAIALCLSSAAAFQAPAAAPASTALRAVDESQLGVQAPAGFFDPLGFVAKDGPEAFVRRRAVERKHGRISMVAITGVLVHNAQIEFPGYLSKSADLKFSDVPDGLGGFFSIPAAGLAQIFALCGCIEHLDFQFGYQGSGGRQRHPVFDTLPSGGLGSRLDREGAFPIVDQYDRLVSRPAAPLQSKGGNNYDEIPEHVFILSSNLDSIRTINGIYFVKKIVI